MPEEVLYYLDLKNISTECSGNCFCIRDRALWINAAGRSFLIRRGFDYLDPGVLCSSEQTIVTAVVFLP